MFYLAKTKISLDKFQEIKAEYMGKSGVISAPDVIPFDFRLYPYLYIVGIDTRRTEVGAKVGVIHGEKYIGIAFHERSYWLLMDIGNVVYLAVNGSLKELTDIPDDICNTDDDVLFYDTPTPEIKWYEKTKISKEEYAVRLTNLERQKNTDFYMDKFDSLFNETLIELICSNRFILKAEDGMLRSKELIDMARNLAVTKLVEQEVFPRAKVPTPKNTIIALGKGDFYWYVNSWIVLRVNTIYNEGNDIVAEFFHKVNGKVVHFKAVMNADGFGIRVI